MKKILILGGSGFIGTKLVERLQSNPGYEIISTYHAHLPHLRHSRWIKLDINDRQQLQEMLSRISPDIIINLITYAQGSSHVEACQKNPKKCSLVNVSPTRIIAAYCHKKKRVKYIFVSSSQVFSRKGKHTEHDLPLPWNEYGRTKLQAENIIARLPNYAIIRPCVVYGIPLPFQHGNIVTHIYKTIRAGKEFTAYTDMLRSPGYVQDVVRLVEKITLQDARGIFHVPGDSTSIYEFAKAIAAFFNLDARYLKSGSAAKEPTYRTRNTSLDSTFTQKQLSLKPTPWEKAFAEMKVKLK